MRVDGISIRAFKFVCFDVAQISRKLLEQKTTLFVEERKHRDGEEQKERTGNMRVRANVANSWARMLMFCEWARHRHESRHFFYSWRLAPVESCTVDCGSYDGGMTSIRSLCIFQIYASPCNCTLRQHRIRPLQFERRAIYCLVCWRNDECITITIFVAICKRILHITIIRYFMRCGYLWFGRTQLHATMFQSCSKPFAWKKRPTSISIPIYLDMARFSF